jgi:hypothetical protein
LEDELRSRKSKAEAKLIEAQARKVTAESRLLELKLLRNVLFLASGIVIAVQGLPHLPDLTSLQEVVRLALR